MPHRHLNVIIVAACVSVLCYAMNRRVRTAMMVSDALQLIDAYYVDPVEKDDLLVAAMNGMTANLDEHSEYIPRDDYESFQDNINQEFAGIGIFVEQPEEGEPVQVITPLVDSPALEAGILPGDAIIGINGENVSALPLRDVSGRLKGPIGTTVKLTVRRSKDEQNLTVRRGRIELQSVIGDFRDNQNRWVYRLKDDPAIAYVRLTSFGEKTVRELEGVLKDLDNDFDALVLDLRGNGGGLLHAAVDVSNMFLSSGGIVSTRTRGGVMEDRFDAEPGVLVNEAKPVAVLIDENSASASEIVAASLQDNGRAAIVGMRSYGKGTVQNILPLQFGRSALRLTVARYYRPNGENIHRLKDATEEDQWGVSPDEGLAVELDDATLEKVAKRWREASYPSLATVGGGKEAAAQSEPVPVQNVPEPNPESGTGTSDSQVFSETKAGETKAGETKAGETKAGETGLDIDAQLRRAVEYLRQQSSPQQTAAQAA
jgi:carboxyl-terminal processing protease